MPFLNRFRLPLKITRAQFPIAREVFTKSNGETVVLSAVISKTYQGETDFLPEKLHERIVVALSHDTVNIEGEKYIGGIVLNGEYSVDWQNFLDYPVAKASFEVLSSPFAARNTNCGTCEEYSQVVTNDDDIGTIGEDETVIVPILYNDSICCSPFEISLVTFNTTYLDSANVVGNTLEIHTKTGIPTQNSVILATYRVTCQNGMYDEANVIANVEGSIEECLSPTGVATLVITGTSATVRWFTPTPAPACDFVWNLYLASDLGTPVQTGTKNANLFPPYLTTLSINDLLPNTNYVLQVASDCCDGDLSPFVSLPFTTNPPEEEEICGTYELTLEDNCGFEVHRVTVSYLACNDTYQQIVIFTFAPQSICMKQTSPGVPVYYEIIATTLPPECQPPSLTVTYTGPC